LTAPNAGGVTDAVLLERFVTSRDESAFELLLHRHGPMVLGVCRRLLRHEQDAEDAFQATFVVLARKAASVSAGVALPAWLYRVAYRSALEAKAQSSRRAAYERRLIEAAIVNVRPPDALLDALDDAVAALPDKYRAPVVLCHLEGRSYAEAAELLGCPAGTIAIHLSRARERLRAWLVRRGLVVSAGTLASVLAAAGREAPAALTNHAVRAALAAAAVPVAETAPTPVVALAEGVLRTMFKAKLKNVAILVVLITFAATGTSMLAYGLQDPPSTPKESIKRPATKSEDRVKTLTQARAKAAQKAYEAVWEAYKEQRRQEEDVYQWSVRVLEIQRHGGASKAERVAALEKHLQRMKELERMAPSRSKKYVNGGVVIVNGAPMPNKPMQVPDEKVQITEFYRVEAELWLEKARTGK
jgi:RNA polymerase sigma factor (sigma-70 family)